MTTPGLGHTFYMSVAEDLCILEASPAFTKVFKAPITGKRVADLFRLRNPALPWSKSILSMFEGQLIGLEIMEGAKIPFGASLKRMEDGGYALFAFPQLTRVDQLQQLNLTLSDFEPHESINFFIGTLQIKESMFAQLEQVSSKLERQNKVLEEKVRKRTKELFLAEKMASLGTLAAGVAHEINNPIGYIQSNLGALSAYTHTLLTLTRAFEDLTKSDPAAAKVWAGCIVEALRGEDLDYIYEDIGDVIESSLEGCQRVTKIVGNLRNFAHPEQHADAAIDLRESIMVACELANNEIRHAAELKLDIQSLPEIIGNEGEITQVFINLLVNAAQAMDDFGCIEITGKVVDEQVEICVRDNGSGIPQENLECLFDPFFTTKEIGTGTGLGLSISHGIIRRHGGTITVESELGRGTTFRLRLPVPAA